MSEPVRSALQIEIAEAVARSGNTRDHYDSLLKKKLDTSGKPLWDIERGKAKNPNPKTLRAIEEVLGYEADYLVNLVHPRSDGARTVVVQKHAAGHSARLSEQPQVHTVDAGETVGIVQLDISAAMGPGRIIEEYVESDVVAFDISLLRKITSTDSDRLRLITGIGSSHEPKFLSGDQFLIDINDKSLTHIDGYYWITFEGAYALKRLRPVSGGKIQVVSENKADYEPFTVDKRELRIEGRAIWFARGL